MIKQYQLTDGQEIFAESIWMEPHKVAEANKNASEHTGGNVWYEPVQWHESDTDYFEAVYSSPH